MAELIGLQKGCAVSARSEAQSDPRDASVVALSPREERRRVRMETTRSQVLDAAERAFAAGGYHTTTIKSIAEQCEISVGTIYLLFDDKESVYQAVLTRRGVALRDVVEARAVAPGPCDRALVELAKLQIQYFREHPEWTKVASGLVAGSRAALTSPESSQIFEVGHQFVADVIAGVIARGQVEGTVRAGDAHALALIFLGMLETYDRIDISGSDRQSTFDLDEFLELLHNAFASSNT